MATLRELTEQGIVEFRQWLDSRPVTGPPPEGLLLHPQFARRLNGIEIDETRQFASRFEFGEYLNMALGTFGRQELLKAEHDGLWAWLAVAYFAQLASAGVRRAEHYVVIRRGAAGSLAHRQAARTAYLLVSYHGANARICLSQPMHTHGQLLESLSAKQAIAFNTGLFSAAALLYMRNGKLRRGAASKPKAPADRKPGEATGMGSVRRLPLALERLDLTYDIDCLSADQLVAKLPREFWHWTTS